VRLLAIKSPVGSISSISPPSSEAELLYGKPARLKVEFASGVTVGLDDGSGYVDMSLSQWDKNPFKGGNKLKAPQLTIRTKASHHQTSNEIDSFSTTMKSYSYFISFRFDSKQDFSSNTTFPACTLYDSSTKAFTVGCPGCKMVVYNSVNVTYGCDDVSRLLVSHHHRNNRYLSSISNNDDITISTDDESTSTSGDDGNVFGDDATAADDYTGDDYLSGKQTSASSINYGVLLSTFTVTLSGNTFAINFEKSKIIIFLVSSIFITIAIGSLYYNRIDVMNRRKSIYIKVKEKDKSSKEVNDKYISKFDIVNSDDNLHLRSDTKIQMEDINDNVENDFIQKVFELEGFLSDHPFSFSKDKPKKDKQEEVDLTPQLHGWITFWLQNLASIFVSTLFFSTFFPDVGQCESCKSEDTCLTPKNNALNTPLCMWKAQKKVTNGGTCSLSPPPQDASFTFILVVLTIIVTIPIVMFLESILYYAFQRPKLSLWGWNEEFWLGKIECFSLIILL